MITIELKRLRIRDDFKSLAPGTPLLLTTGGTLSCGTYLGDGESVASIHHDSVIRPMNLGWTAYEVVKSSRKHYSKFPSVLIDRIASKPVKVNKYRLSLDIDMWYDLIRVSRYNQTFYFDKDAEAIKKSIAEFDSKINKQPFYEVMKNYRSKLSELKKNGTSTTVPRNCNVWALNHSDPTISNKFLVADGRGNLKLAEGDTVYTYGFSWTPVIVVPDSLPINELSILNDNPVVFSSEDTNTPYRIRFTPVNGSYKFGETSTKISRTCARQIIDEMEPHVHTVREDIKTKQEIKDKYKFVDIVTGNALSID